MQSGFTSYHWDDEQGKPGGGQTFGNGFAIAWQRGPLGRGEGRVDPNGAFVEDVIAAVVDRIEQYQLGEFECTENSWALTHLREALASLEGRTKDREARGVEGTHAT